MNGKPSCANDWLLSTVARGEWGFEGYVTSDCGADANVFFNHHYTKTPEESVAAVLHAGTDVDCGDFVTKCVDWPEMSQRTRRAHTQSVSLAAPSMARFITTRVLFLRQGA